MLRGGMAGAAVGLAIVLGDMAPARADHLPVIAVPGRAGTAVIIEGYGANGAVIYGDYGLYRPGHVPTIIEGPIHAPLAHSQGGYYPSLGVAPRLGRHEIEPRMRRARPARDYSRSWSAGSGGGPVTEYPPFDPPEVILAPHRRNSDGANRRAPKGR